MSWSVQFEGNAFDVAAKLKEHSNNIADAVSKEEYDSALPHLVGLIEQQVNDAATTGPQVKITANGSGYKDGAGKVVNRRDRKSVV